MALLVAAPVRAQEKPRLPYYDWGACPFECCTYREWTARRSLVAHGSRSRRAPRGFRIRQGERVRGVTGVVITRQYGITEISRDMKIGYTKTGRSPELALHAGDVVYTLHYVGEGSDLFWYRGRTYSDEISVPENAWGEVPHSAAVRVKSRPKIEWWVKVRNRDGQVGWTDETDAFDDMDACG